MLEVKQKSFLSLEATFSILITPISRRRRYNLLNTLGSTLTAQTHIDLLLTVYLRRLIYMRWKSLLCSNPATLESTIRFFHDSLVWKTANKVNSHCSDSN